MLFNENEQRTIASAEKKLRQDNTARTIIMITLALATLLVLSGQLDSRALSGLSLFLVAIAMGQPNIIKGPKYEDLLNLLRKKNK